jgi:hypothetical protein
MGAVCSSRHLVSRPSTPRSNVVCHAGMPARFIQLLCERANSKGIWYALLIYWTLIYCHACRMHAPDLLQDSSVKVALLSYARPDSFKGSSVKVDVGIGEPLHIFLKSLISHTEPSFRKLKIPHSHFIRGSRTWKQLLERCRASRLQQARDRMYCYTCSSTRRARCLPTCSKQAWELRISSAPLPRTHKHSIAFSFSFFRSLPNTAHLHARPPRHTICCFTAALLLLYCCFTAVVLLLDCQKASN